MLEEHGALSRGAFAVAVLVSLAVLFTPASDVPSAPFGVDKAVHVVVFAVLALTGRWAGFRRPPLVILLTGYAAVCEVVQQLSPLGRSASVGDWLADVIGLLCGVLLWAVLRSRRRLAR